MINLPLQFRALKGYPGYFWNTNNECLYSIKIGGVLKRLSRRMPNKWTHMSHPFYEVYNRGQRRYLTIDRIKSLTMKDHTIPFDSEAYYC